jgi:K(+)-stimulated pyrophosphate-energized sodium pump
MQVVLQKVRLSLLFTWYIVSQLDPKVRERTDVLDSVGNTTAAVGKGFAIASAVLTGFSLLNVFKQKVSLGTFDIISDPYAIAGKKI